VPYHPSQIDYRLPGEPALPILEVPMSVAPIHAPYDTEGVIRYINLAYYPAILRAPLAHWIAQHTHLVTITHPYELAPRKEGHGLLAFDPVALEQNLTAIRTIAEEQAKTISWLTVSDFATSLQEYPVANARV
jgi:hypothetical protein